MIPGYDAHTYGSDYWNGRKRYRVRENGSYVEKEYQGPALHWEGFGPIAEALFRVCGVPPTLLDVGCGGGSFVGYAATLGSDASGVDVSEEALSRPAPNAAGRLSRADVTRDAPPGRFHMVTALDIFEHVFVEDQGRFQRYLWDACMPRGILVACIGTATVADHIWIHRPGEEVPLDREWQAVSGHVTIMPYAWWVQLLEGIGWNIDLTSSSMFEAWRRTTPAFDKLEAWDSQHLVIARRP